MSDEKLPVAWKVNALDECKWLLVSLFALGLAFGFAVGVHAARKHAESVLSAADRAVAAQRELIAEYDKQCAPFLENQNWATLMIRFDSEPFVSYSPPPVSPRNLFLKILVQETEKSGRLARAEWYVPYKITPKSFHCEEEVFYWLNVSENKLDGPHKPECVK